MSYIRANKQRPVLDTILTKADEYRTLKNHDTKDEASLDLHVLDRHPMQPAWPAMHPAIEKSRAGDENPPYEKMKPLMENIDAARHRLFRELARAVDQDERIARRVADETLARERHALNWIMGETRRRADFFKKVYAITVDRETRGREARRRDQLLYDFVRERALHHAIRWKEETQRKTIEGFETRKENWHWRLDDLWAPSSTGGVVKIWGVGEELEAALADIGWEKRAEATQMAWSWRKDNLYIKLANGALRRSDLGSGGLLESVTAQREAPLRALRTQDAEDWHNTNFRILTPNDGLIEAQKQGGMPEAMQAARAWPEKYEVTEGYDRWRQSGRFFQTPNGGMARLAEVGQAMERASAAMEHPKKRARTEQHYTWRRDTLFGPTPNGGWARLKEVGQSLEEVSGDRSEIVRDRITESLADRRFSHRFARTPNGGFAQLKYVGHMLEAVTGEYTAEARAEATENHAVRRFNHLFAETPNGGFAPLPGHGRSLEDVGADFRQGVANEQTDWLDVRRFSERYVRTPNGGYARLAEVGNHMEEVNGDFRSDNAAEQTQHFREVRYSDLYTTTPNDVIRRLPGIGTPMVEAMEDAQLRSEAGLPKVSPSSTARTAGLKAFENQLAALDKQESQLAGHTAKLPEQPKAPEPEPKIRPKADPKVG